MLSLYFLVVTIIIYYTQLVSVLFIQRKAVQDQTFGLKYSDLVRSQDFSHLSNDHVDRLELNISAGHKLIGVGTVNIYNIYSLLYLQVII